MMRKILLSLGFGLLLMIFSMLAVFMQFVFFGSNGGDPLIVTVIFNVVAWPLLLAIYLGQNELLPFYYDGAVVHSSFYGFFIGWAAYSIIIFFYLSLFGKSSHFSSDEVSTGNAVTGFPIRSKNGLYSKC